MNLQTLFALLTVFFLVACEEGTWNNPYPADEAKANIFYTSFYEQPKTLDPARSYTAEEVAFTAQIYEPPLQYHYLLRPYTLVPLTATQVPQPVYLDKEKRLLPNSPATRVHREPQRIAYSVYTIRIKPGIYYQPHPAFAKRERAEGSGYYFHHLTKNDLQNIDTLNDFPRQGTRELTAEDYVYQIKRLAHPRLESPIFGLMSGYIVGLNDLQKNLQTTYQKLTAQKKQPIFLDLRQFPLSGVKVIDRYTYQITIKGEYSQFVYWLAMPFFAPIPWEADYFYSQPGMAEKNISFNWYPVGTGPYYLFVNNPNREIILLKNPYFHGELYPTVGESNDEKRGFLKNTGKPLPFLDRLIFKLEKESIPRWNKFLQGYYDHSAISSDNFDQAIRIDVQGKPQLTPEIQKKGIHLKTSVANTVFFLGFNMLDDVVGGSSDRARKLRQAIAVAVNYEEYIAIFLNGRGIPAQGPIPPGIFGYRNGKEGINPYLYEWGNGKAKRRSLAEAKRLLVEAGYPGGKDPKTGLPLLLHYDVPVTGGPDEKSVLAWMRKQFAKLGIELQIRDTQYNRFQEKMRVGNAQIFFWGWNADYPDPENFLFLLHGPNGKVKYGGENATNYQNAEYDRLFDIMKNLPNGAQRQAVIDRMLAIIRYDSPWVWAFYPQTFLLSHAWVFPTKPGDMINNTSKYVRIDPLQRAQKRLAWNRPAVWPLMLLVALCFAGLIPVIVRFWQKEHTPYRQRRTRN